MVDSSNGEITLDVGGVGYRISMSSAGLARHRSSGGEIFVWIHHQQREDSQTLFGFADQEERETFEVLIGTHGVGPSLALAILATLDPSTLRTTVITEDLSSLCRVPGVGKKTAQRLLVELSTRFDASAVDLRRGDESGTSAGSAGDDLIDALIALGYRGDEIASVIGSVPAEGSVADRLKFALGRLAS